MMFDYPVRIISGGADFAITVICGILAVGGGIAVYLAFMSPKKEGELTGFAALLHEFLNFKVMFAEVLLKILYVISALWLTLSSFGNLLVSFAGTVRAVGPAFIAFLATVVFGNIALRLVYEFLLLLLVICRNTTDINRKMGGDVSAPQQYAPPAEPYQAPPPPPPFNPSPEPADEQSGAKVFCYNCGKQISASAPACPHCGAPKM